MISQSLFTVFVLVLANQHLRHYLKSEKNARWLIKQGGREYKASHFPLILTLNVCWFLAMLVEVWWFNSSYHIVFSIFALAIFLFGQALRILAMQELNARWTARIITIPGLIPITSGVFRYLRHPSYVGTILEIASAPLLHGAAFTSLVFSVLNLIMLRVLVKAEERALNQDNYYYSILYRAKRV
jgi:methyltransferase